MNTHSLTLPAPPEYASAVEALSDAHDAVEAIEWRLQRIVDAFERDDQLAQPPQPDDVGELYGFVQTLDVVAAQLATKCEELRRELAAVNLMRLDGVDAQIRT